MYVYNIRTCPKKDIPERIKNNKKEKNRKIRLSKKAGHQKP